MFGVTVYEIYIIVDKLLSNPIEVDISLMYAPRPFVVFTICNINPYKYTVVQTNPAYADLATLMEDYMRVVDANYADIENDHFGFNQASSVFEKELFAETAQVLIANQLSDEAIRNATYSFDEFIRYCYYNGAPCNSSDFTTFYDATYGACFQYNGASDVMVYKAGSYFGLRVMAFAAQEDPNGNLLALPTTKTAGVRIGLSYSQQWMEMESYGLDCPNGAETMVSMQMTQTQKLGKPYSDCVDSVPGSMNFYSQFNYSIENCIRTCIQQHIIDACGCADPRYQKPANVSFCTVGKNASASFANFPPKAYKVLDGPGMGQDYACYNPNNLFGGNVQKCIKWFKENAAVLNVWYDGLDYEQNTENANYKISNAANDLGGQLGLWTGLSVASIVEVAILILVSIMYCISGRKVKVDVHEEEVTVDPRAERIKQLRDELDEHERIANALREAILSQAVQEEQQRIALAQQQAAVQAAAEQANAAAAAGAPQVPYPQVLPGEVPQ
ncbi:Protein ASIC-2 [Aphelenchoides avenae]|nr:Protein ASIC-2 [Aphelenchus avenae]